MLSRPMPIDEVYTANPKHRSPSDAHTHPNRSPKRRFIQPDWCSGACSHHDRKATV